MAKRMVGHMGKHEIELAQTNSLDDAYALYRKVLDGKRNLRQILISIQHNPDPADLVDSVIHESVHALGDIFGIEDNEQLAHTAAVALTQMWVEMGLIDPKAWARKVKKARML